MAQQTRPIPFNKPNPVASQQPVQYLDDDGAITIPGGYVILDKAGAIAATLADPTVDGLEITVISATAQAHTLDLVSGVDGGAADVGTYGGAIADRVTLFSYDGSWWTKQNTNVTFA